MSDVCGETADSADGAGKDIMIVKSSLFLY